MLLDNMCLTPVNMPLKCEVTGFVSENKNIKEAF